MADNKIYWSGLEELDRTPEFEQLESQEFPAERPWTSSSPTTVSSAPTPAAGTSSSSWASP